MSCNLYVNYVKKLIEEDQEGGIIVHVAASQLTSSKLCSTSNPMAEKPSKFPSPSICVLVNLCMHALGVRTVTYVVKQTRVAAQLLDLSHPEQYQPL